MSETKQPDTLLTKRATEGSGILQELEDQHKVYTEEHKQKEKRNACTHS